MDKIFHFAILVSLTACVNMQTQIVREPGAQKQGSLPNSLDLGGAVSSVRVADLDGDGFQDIVAIVYKGNSKSELVVAWGDAKASWQNRWSHSFDVDASQPSRLRDVSSHVIELGDPGKKGRLDIVTSEGIAVNKGPRDFAWMPLLPQQPPLLPVGIIGAGVVRAAGASVEVCDLTTHRCKAMAIPNGTPIDKITDLAIGDFDKDGRDDFVAGWIGFDPKDVSALYWRSTDKYETPMPLKIPGLDYQVGDVDGDGYPELVAQDLNPMTDFPGRSAVFTSSKKGFTRIQTFTNSQNHNDKAHLVDVDGDGCLDYLQTGVDVPKVGLLKGDCHFLGAHNSKGAVDSGSFKSIKADSSVGVQCLDLLGSGKCALVLRGQDKNHRDVLEFFGL